MEQKFERIYKITPAFDKRNEDPSKNYGIHSCELFMVLKGEKGAVIFTMSTSWFLKSTTPWLEECRKRMGGLINEWRGNAVSYCSAIKLHDWQEGRENCDWLGCTCYGDSSYVIADDVAEILVSEGDEAVWKWLENNYASTFN